MYTFVKYEYIYKVCIYFTMYCNSYVGFYYFYFMLCLLSLFTQVQSETSKTDYWNISVIIIGN